MNVNDDLKKLMPYGLAFLAIFLLLPLTSFVIKAKGWLDVIILGINPISCIVISYLYAYKNDFDWMYIVVAPAIFLIANSIYYSSIFVVYVIFYAGFCLTGVAFGKWRRDNKQKQADPHRNLKRR